jgi:hypothetical protein
VQPDQRRIDLLLRVCLSRGALRQREAEPLAPVSRGHQLFVRLVNSGLHLEEAWHTRRTALHEGRPQQVAVARDSRDGRAVGDHGARLVEAVDDSDPFQEMPQGRANLFGRLDQVDRVRGIGRQDRPLRRSVGLAASDHDPGTAGVIALQKGQCLDGGVDRAHGDRVGGRTEGGTDGRLGPRFDGEDGGNRAEQA